MKLQPRIALAVSSALAFAGAVQAANQPKDVVTSDNEANTAMGTDALISLTGGGANTAAGNNALYSNDNGMYNTAMGDEALYYNTGDNNSAFGSGALDSNTTGVANTAVGTDALQSNQTGAANTATGMYALWRNNYGNYNTAIGYEALWYNDNGNDNTASGFGALYNNASGSDNTASGYDALVMNSTGGYNTAAGMKALYSNTTADYNTADGYGALYSNADGAQNTASGYLTLYTNRTGTGNAAFGLKALYVSTGNYNTALGFHAGLNLTGGSNDVDIASLGVAGESGVIRIGTEGTQTSTYIAGISGNVMTGGTVVVSASGKLGVLSSSRRFKTDIAALTDTEKLQQLRPVSFHLKSEPKGALQYGLIAEEVEKVYPELVFRDADGNIQGVRYDELAPMLLNEVQQQKIELEQQQAELRQLKQMNLAMQAAIAKREQSDARVASR